MSRSHAQQVVNEADDLYVIREALRAAAKEKELPYGIPMPLGDSTLVVEPSYPFAEWLNAPEAAPSERIKLINEWYSHGKRCRIAIWDIDGKRVASARPAFHHVDFAMQTMACSDAWGIEQESKALQLLGTMIRHVHFKRYLLSGMFLDQSPRSGVYYLFRKLRPTLALAADPHGNMRVLAALCMHPIAYYQGSWAGAMCPTDDVIAHLTLMRGDEHMFWKRCNQHPAHTPEAGI